MKPKLEWKFLYVSVKVVAVIYNVLTLSPIPCWNKSISYLLCNKGIIVNLYKLYFPSFFFSLQPNKKVFHPPTFPLIQPNTQEGKLNIFHPPTFPSSYNFLSFHFSTPPTKQTLNVKKKSHEWNQNFKFSYI